MRGITDQPEICVTHAPERTLDSRRSIDRSVAQAIDRLVSSGAGEPVGSKRITWDSLRTQRREAVNTSLAVNGPVRGGVQQGAAAMCRAALCVIPGSSFGVDGSGGWQHVNGGLASTVRERRSIGGSAPRNANTCALS